MKTHKRKKKSKKKKQRVSVLVKFAFLIAFLVLATDILTKHLVHSHIPLMNHDLQWYPYGGVGVFENILGIEFSLVHATNKGAAWGMFADLQEYLLLFRMIFISGLLVYLLFYNKNKALIIPFILIVVGALGNILDYFIYGHVVDMLHFVLWGYNYPIFNIADSSIFLGICSVLCISLIENRKTEQRST